jgi:Flp pilus assembly protein TadD
VAAFRNALALKPGDRNALFNLGVALVSLGDLRGATETAVALARVDPDGARRLREAIERARTGGRSPWRAGGAGGMAPAEP